MILHSALFVLIFCHFSLFVTSEVEGVYASVKFVCGNCRLFGTFSYGSGKSVRRTIEAKKNSSIIGKGCDCAMMIWLHIAESFRFYFPPPHKHERRPLSISGTCKTIID